MAESTINITANDCLPFEQQEQLIPVVNHILKQEQVQTFHFSHVYLPDEGEKMIDFDFLSHQWKAGRFVGEMEFFCNNQRYKLTIKPRFGKLFLFRMLEEIFNIKILPSHSEESSTVDWQHYIKRIISFIWLHKLAASNRYGVPKQNHLVEHKGTTVKGKLNVRNSILPYYTSNEIISNSPEKIEYGIASRIIWQASRILVKNFDLGMFKTPDAAKDAIDHISRVKSLNHYVSESDFRNIKLKAIYQNWKPIIDFSWDIIKSKPFHKKQADKNQSFSFFIDMAEVWELYVKSLLKKQLMLSGWNLKEDNISTYPEKYFKRQLIPDIVFERDDEVLVWDAKYKRMKWDIRDFDRTDFFQIHTYIHYYQQLKKVKCGGLLYPLNCPPEQYEKSKSDYLFGGNTNSTTFIADGIDLSFCNSNNEKTDEYIVQFKKKENEFLSRIKTIIEMSCPENNL